MFALLEHVTTDGIHWDLIVESPGSERLATWRLADNPLTSPLPIAALRIADHRAIYLDFEGEITGGRGHILRLDRGSGALRVESDTAELRLEGRRLRGLFRIRPADGPATFELAEA